MGSVLHMKTTLLAAILGSAVLAIPALAADECACGEAGCEQACTCESGMCALHRGGRSNPARMSERPVFDAKTVTTFEGVVKEVQRVPHGPQFVGLHLVMSVRGELITVHLGPADFVEPKLTFAAGDVVKAAGSRLTFKGNPTLLATVVKKGSASLELRAADGTPKFRGP